MKISKAYKRSIENELRIAASIARSISKNKGVKISNGQIVNGQK